MGCKSCSDRIRKALTEYYKILEGKRKPRFKSVDLDPRIKKAFKMLERCELCERKCGVNRLKGQTGFCKIGDKPLISSFFVHHGEEPFFVPSFTIFFMSCNLRCQFCQNWTISNMAEQGRIIEEEKLAEIIDQHNSCNNVNFVGGEPTPHLPFILKTLKHVKSDMPVVWNSNFIMSEKAMELLKGVVDVYLSDWKYWSDKCASRLSKFDDYLNVVRRNHLLAFKDAELVIRHLVLPNHFECCTKPILKFIADNFKDKAIVNIMDQFRPEFKANEHNDIDRGLKREEFERVVDYAERLGINFIV